MLSRPWFAEATGAQWNMEIWMFNNVERWALLITGAQDLLLPQPLLPLREMIRDFEGLHSEADLSSSLLEELARTFTSANGKDKQTVKRVEIVPKRKRWLLSVVLLLPRLTANTSRRTRCHFHILKLAVIVSNDLKNCQQLQKEREKDPLIMTQ